MLNLGPLRGVPGTYLIQQTECRTGLGQIPKLFLIFCLVRVSGLACRGEGHDTRTFDTCNPQHDSLPANSSRWHQDLFRYLSRMALK